MMIQLDESLGISTSVMLFFILKMGSKSGSRLEKFLERVLSLLSVSRMLLMLEIADESDNEED